MSPDSDKDEESQDFWHTMTLLGFKIFYLPAVSGLFGENAKKGAEQTAEEMGSILAIFGACAIIAGIVWGIGHLFGIW